MDFLSQYGMFALKSVTIVIALLLSVAGILSLGKNPKPKLTITSLNKEAEDTHQLMYKEVSGKKMKKKKQDKTKNDISRRKDIRIAKIRHDKKKS